MTATLDFYLDIVLEPDAEISAPALMNNLFAKLHRALVMHAQKRDQGDIAVSFPKIGKTLGDILRLHGAKEALETLMEIPWLKGLRDYTQVSGIKPVPESIQGYRTVFRVQQKSPQNMRRRSISKGWLSEEEAHLKIPDSKQKRLSQPFIQLKSQSTKQEMFLFIACGKIEKSPLKGQFSSYGLSKQANIPCF